MKKSCQQRVASALAIVFTAGVVFAEHREVHIEPETYVPLYIEGPLASASGGTILASGENAADFIFQTWHR